MCVKRKPVVTYNIIAMTCNKKTESVALTLGNTKINVFSANSTLLPLSAILV